TDQFLKYFKKTLIAAVVQLFESFLACKRGGGISLGHRTSKDVGLIRGLPLVSASFTPEYRACIWGDRG
ncbi:MAG: hypothetical protein K2Q15_11025, partial [Burkholderiales bacterium]|nr:hypothetical protein [Burkholderiales bacterium]